VLRTTRDDQLGGEVLARLMGGEPAHYQSVVTELYRRFGVASYQLIRMEQ
jgi:hypothetical protein